jgi:uncharacterized protein with gpF-like domain
LKTLRIHRLRKQDEIDSAEVSRLQSLLSSAVSYVRAQFQLFLESVRAPEIIAQLEAAISSGRWYDAYEIVDSFIVRLGNNIASMIPGIGRQEMQTLAEQEGIAGAGVGISFNPTSPQVIEAMQRSRMQFIVEMSADQRLAINQALAQAMREGQTAQEAALRLREALGLTSYQQTMVENYRTLLETNNRQALDRELRDRRYDRGLENAIEEGEILPQDRIDVMVGRYQERLLAMRAETIARTEAGRVLEETRYLSTQQAIDEAGIPRTLAVKQWVATNDDRTRDTHTSMDGQARLIDDYFDSPSGAQLMHPHDSNAPASETINCRCQVANHIFATLEEAQVFLVENGQGKY